MNIFPKILLASKSPRRKQLLIEAGFDIEIVNINVEENYSLDLIREEIPLYLSNKKAKAHLANTENNILLTADTIVWFNNTALNKPVDEEDAIKMLQKLANNVHQVYTGVTLIYKQKTMQFYDVTNVFFAPLTSEEITYYVSKYKPLDKAGAYGIQEWLGYIGVKKIEGCYYNVMGLPIPKVYQKIKEILI